MMKCDRCDNKATVHEVTVTGGKKQEKHLCEQCARNEGLVVQPTEPINALLTKFIMAPTLAGKAARPAPTPAAPSPACASCGMTWGQFKQHGLLGCPECYTSFEALLSPLIERAQEGATHHIGKTPKRAGASIDRQRLLRSLRKELAEAIEKEQYERAAALRDEIRTAEAATDGPAEGKADGGGVGAGPGGSLP